MRRIVLTFVVLTIVGGSVALVYGIVGGGERVVQPIAFNHTLHVNEANIPCVGCHTSAEHEVFAGLPSKTACFDCHDVAQEDATNPEKAKLFSFAANNQDIPWRRVAVTRPDVFFSHRRHVGAGEIDCLTCHRDQQTLTVPPPTARLVMDMKACIECHNHTRASTDCVSCHR